ncbi:FAD-dependent oxidoreductase [Anaerospora hongkongensis]|uniref:FAD-dependent oxidoreductase n=1 Tax=Anaerospora hongkongensis TaxID=244830 RepID=UPI00289DF9C1|nr:FAD-dependent oxidoreductase [Anaerospora hongkongensis]
MGYKMIETEVIVIGGGMAGSLAAIAAARNNVRVVLIEKDLYLGGTATGSLMAEMQGVAKNQELIYGGITQEIIEQLIEEGDGEYNFQVPMSSDPSIKIDRLRYNTESLKILLDELTTKAGVKVLYNCIVDKTEIHGSQCVVTINDRHNSIEVQGKVIIDATGNADIAYDLGYETFKAEPNQIQPTTLMFRLSNIDSTKVKDFIISGRINHVIKNGYETGRLPGKILGISPIPNTCDVTVNTTRGNMVDHESIEDISRGLIETRKQIRRIIPYLRENVEGFEKAVLASIAPQLGVRDCRRIVGKYLLTGDDLIKIRDFEDAVAIGVYPIDIHDHKVDGVVWQEIQGVYKIPFASMVPVKSKRLIVAGKCISADREAFGAIRVIPIVMCIGEAAGYAAALAIKSNKNIDEIDVLVLRDALKKTGIQV